MYELFQSEFLLAQHLISTDTIKKGLKPEIFSSGFIDVMNNGQVNASARFFLN